MTKGIDMKKKIRNDLKKEIRRKFECGEDLIELAIEYKLNYGTLRNLSAKEGWEKGKLLNLVRVKESFEISEQAVKKRAEIIEQYKELTENLRAYAIGEYDPEIKAKEEAFLKRVMAIDTLYKLDKELHSIHSDSELIELKKEQLKYEKLKKELEEEQESILLD